MIGKHERGRVIRQAQTTWPDGTYEEHHARDGFAGECSQLYRRHPTTDWSRVEGPLRPRGIMTYDVPTEENDDPRGMPAMLLSNDEVTVSVSRRRAEMPFCFRNADGDTVILVQEGQGFLITDYGVLEYGPLEYLVIPKGTNYRLAPGQGEHLSYVIETREPVAIPDRGLLGHFLPFDVGVLDVPRLAPADDPRMATPSREGEWEILVKRGGELSSIFYGFDPMDVEGWQGHVTPFRLRLADIRPLTSERLDVPPMTHATFRAGGVWFCTFAPRPWQTAPDAVRPQPYHRNVDYDEVMIYLGSPDGTPAGPPPGELTVTPAGMNHGPNAARLGTEMTRLPLYMLNLDTRLPLRPTAVFEQWENQAFADAQRFRGQRRDAFASAT